MTCLSYKELMDGLSVRGGVGASPLPHCTTIVSEVSRRR
jgi:hypothetical protein